MSTTNEDEAPESTAEEAPPRAVDEDRIAAWVGQARVPAEWAEVLTRWLERQFVSDQYARLEQAGHNLEEAIPLAPVFVDLEVSSGPQASMPPEPNPENGFVAQALARTPKLLGDRERVLAKESLPDPERRSESNGYVLIGGPGQGKSTVGQFLCQVHRGALLSPRIEHLGEKGRRALRSLQDQCAEDKLCAAAEPSLPLRIILRDFAAWMAKTGAEPRMALLRYLLHQQMELPPERQERAVDELGQILIQAPWLLVLDGLDEVAPSAGRDQMLAAARDFLQCFANAGARGLVIGTTRPQGYAGEFAGLDLETRYLIPLSRKRALAYAKRLVRVRFHDMHDRQQKVLERLETASREEATARLMQSPLQVTILATLVDRIGRAPQERWRLFHDYYKVIYEREMERPGEAAELLRNHRGNVDRIHMKVGLLLQVESERSGGTEALMPRERLEQVVDETLAEDDDDKTRRDRLVRQVLDAAENRLVFLVSPQADRVGFEIRSLQEFMAAWALTSKSEAIVEARLTQIAPAASFRNVLLFAASRYFAELSDLRDFFVDRLCPELNEADDVTRAILAGSVLALEILEDGSALNQPKYVRKLMVLAARLVELPPDGLHVALAAVCEGDAEAPLRVAVEAALNKEAFAKRLGGWVILVALIDRGIGWARELGDQRWPSASPSTRPPSSRARPRP